MHKAGGYLAMDFMNLIFPRAQKKILSIIPAIGGGAAWYRRAIYYKDDRYYDASKGKWINPTHGRGNTRGYINDEGEFAGDYDKDYNIIGYLQAGVNVEFNLNRTIALGVRATYNYFINDYPDGRGYSGMQSLASKNNDGLVDVTLNMRFKLMAVSKTHVRNIANEDKLLARMAELEKEPTTNAGMGMCHDTVIIYHDTIIKQYREVQKDEQNVYYVYFDNGKAIIKEDGLITIQQVADRLEEDTTLYAVVTGFCDNTGSDKLNYVLGDKRAANVMDELSQEHGISDERMYAMGMVNSSAVAARLLTDRTVALLSVWWTRLPSSV
jgi:outer membrane protein OmpA-like peptidoglycan-associated protein